MTRTPIAERFWSKVDRRGPDECWPWMAHRDRRGYGQIGDENWQIVRAHRVAVELSGTPIPAGMSVLHSCDNPPCVNPAHLRVGTPGDNLRDMYARGRQPAHLGRQEFCKRGHSLSGANEIVRSDGRHQCRTCRRAANRISQPLRRLRASPALALTPVRVPSMRPGR